VRKLVEHKRPQFLSGEDFDASELGMKFDYVLSHSILSHAAHWQLEPFFQKSAAVLASDGKILASIRLAEGNAFGSPGSADRRDSRYGEWQYPGVSFFTLDTVERAAAAAGLKARVKPEYTALLTARRPAEFHDWLLVTRAGASARTVRPTIPPDGS
jgi:hypothetical protein